MKATRRAVVAASGAGALGLAGCTADGSTSTSAPTGPGESSTDEAEPAQPADPDQVALDRAVAITTALLTALEASPPELDPAGRLAALHAAHLGVLQEATGSTSTPSPPGNRLTPARLRRRELRAQRELARLAQAAESGALARLFASMSAGIAAGLSHRGEVPR